MNTDINGFLTPENDPQVKIDTPQKADQKLAETAIEKVTPKFGVARNESEQRIQRVGINCIQNQQRVSHFFIKKRAIARILHTLFDAKAFEKYVQQDAKHQEQMNELKRIQDHIEDDREEKVEKLHSKPKEDLAHQLERIEIERVDAA